MRILSQTLHKFKLCFVVYLIILVFVKHFSRLVTSKLVANIILKYSQFCGFLRDHPKLQQELTSLVQRTKCIKPNDIRPSDLKPTGLLPFKVSHFRGKYSKLIFSISESPVFKTGITSYKWNTVWNFIRFPESGRAEITS